MKQVNFNLKVNIPELKEFQKQYPQYSNIAENEGNDLFKLIRTSNSFLTSKILTDNNLPAVLGVAEICYKTRKKNLNDFTKQFIGASVCALMTANGYIKTGTKKSVRHPAFKKGEFYVRK
jgi:hypothetical protein